jgi:hypothetical protein
MRARLKDSLVKKKVCFVHESLSQKELKSNLPVNKIPRLDATILP